MKSVQDKTKRILTSLLLVALGYGSQASAQSGAAAPMKSAAQAPTLKVAQNEESATSSSSVQLSSPVLQSQTNTSVTKLPQPEALSDNAGKRLSVATGVEYSQKIATEERGQRESSNDFSLSLSYKTTDLTTLSTKAVVSKENNGQKNTSISNTKIILGIKGYQFNDYLTSVHSVTGVVPTNEESQKIDRLQSAMSISNGFTYTLPSIKIDYRLGLARNFHEFNVNAEGKANIEYTLSNLLGVDIPVIGGFHVSGDILYKNSRTYGNFERSSFIFNADLNYDINENFTMNVGTSNDASALKANGVDSNISAYDDKSSVLRAGLAYTY